MSDQQPDPAAPAASPSPTAGGRRVVIRPVLPDDLTPDRREVADRELVAAQAAAALDSVRATAASWRTGLSGLLALVSAALVFKGRDSITAYASWVQVTLGVLVSVALVLGVVSLWLFLRSAYGVPRVVATQQTLDRGGVAVARLEEAVAAARTLGVARVLAVLSAGLLAAGLLLSWYGPPAPSEPLVRAELGPGNVSCGRLVSLDGQQLVLQVAGGTTSTRLGTADLVALTVVTAC